MDRTGTEGADYISIVSFGTRGENDARWLAKGRLVAIAGRLHHNTWTDNDGNKRERYEVNANTVSYLDSPRTKTTGDIEPAPGEEAF